MRNRKKRFLKMFAQAVWHYDKTFDEEERVLKLRKQWDEQIKNLGNDIQRFFNVNVNEVNWMPLYKKYDAEMTAKKGRRDE